MIPYNSEERARWRKRRRTIRRITVAAECLAIVAILAAGAMFIGSKMLPETVRILPLEQPPPPIRPKRKQLTLQKASLPVLSKVRHPQKKPPQRHRLRAFFPRLLPWLPGMITTRPFPCFRRILRWHPFRRSSLRLPSTKRSVSPWFELLSAK